MRIGLVTTVLMTIMAGASVAQEHNAGHAMQAGQLAWGPAPPVLPKGAQFAVLSGDPSKSGQFTVRLNCSAPPASPASRGLSSVSRSLPSMKRVIAAPQS
jgi:hypothetical protein